MNTLVNIHVTNNSTPAYRQAGVVILLLTGLFFSTSVQAQVWTLQQCLDSARQHNKNLLIARNNIEIGQQKMQEAKANLIPKLTVNADYRYYINLPYQFMPQEAFGGPEGVFKEIQFGVPHNINTNLQLAIPLYNPQVQGGIQSSKIASELTVLQHQKSEEQVLYEVTNFYYNAQILRYQTAYLEGNLINANKLLQNMKLLKEQLLAKVTDVSKVQLQVEQLTDQRELIVSKYDQVLNALKIAVGMPLTQPLVVEESIVTTPSHAYEQTATLDVRIIEKQNTLLQSELSTFKNSRLPSVSLYGSYGVTGFGYDKTPNEFLKFYPVSFAGLQLSYSLFNGTVTRQKISQKKLEIKNKELQAGLTSDQTVLYIETAHQQKSVAQRSVETTLAQVQLAQSIYDQTILQQKQGVASLTDVLLADNALRETQQGHVSALIDYLKADLDHKKATGNLFIK
jgi:OMF family outer membrane factor